MCAVDVTSGLSALRQAVEVLSMADTGVLESLLRLVEKVDGGIDSQDVADSLSVDHQVVVGAVKSLQALGEVSF